MGVTQAGRNAPNTGHHHLLIDANEPLDPNEPIPQDKTHLHFGAGQTIATGQAHTSASARRCQALPIQPTCHFEEDHHHDQMKAPDQLPLLVDAVDKVGDEVVNALICVLWMDWSPLQSGERRDCSRD